MRIGIVSDTHGNRELLHSSVGWLVSDLKIAQLFHLGDYYTDTLDLDFPNLKILQVPGIYHSDYKNGHLAAVEQIEILGWNLSLVHAVDIDIFESDVESSDIILYGHTHIANTKQIGNTIFVNPGHLKSQRDRGQRASFAVIDINQDNIVVSHYYTDKSCFMEETFEKTETGLQSKNAKL